MRRIRRILYTFTGGGKPEAPGFGLAGGLQEAGRVMKWLESEEQACGRTENARAWEGEYIRILHRAIEHLPKDELYAMQQEVAEELKNPYFRARPLRTRASVSLAFFCYPVYRFLRTVYRFCNLGGRKQT